MIWHKEFLAMLPKIRQHASVAFRHMRPEAREEAVQEVISNCVKAFVRLVQLKKVDLAYPTVLARFGVAQVRDGRKVGGKLNVHDVSSDYAQREKGFHLERLDQYDNEDDSWIEVLVEDKSAGPADVASIRIDFTHWLTSLSPRTRRIAKILATGERTSVIAQKFDLSPGRISQVRKELAQSWRLYQGEQPAA